MDRLWRVDLTFLRDDGAFIAQELLDACLDRLPDGSSFSIDNSRRRLGFALLVNADHSLDALANALRWVRDAWRYGIKLPLTSISFGEGEVVPYAEWIAQNDPDGKIHVWAEGGDGT